MDRDVRVRWLILAICVLVPSSARSAAPFVHGQPARLSVQIAESRAAAIARKLPANDGTHVWSLETVLNDNAGSLVIGQQIRPKPAPPADSTLALVISHADRAVSSVGISQAAAEYLRALPRATDPAERRLSHAIGHLGSSDAVIAADVFAELAALDRKTLESFRSKLPADSLRKLVDVEMSGERLGLYGYLLGLCGDERDIDRLQQRFLSAEPFAGGADGLAAGYLLVAGEPGLAALESDVLLSNEVSPLFASAFFDALRFFRECEKSPFARERLTRSACCGFSRPETTDLAVGYLVASREWGAMPRVIALLDANDDDVTRKRAIQVITVRYLLECRRDTDTTAANRAIATRALSRIGEKDPDLLRRAMYLAGDAPSVQ